VKEDRIIDIETKLAHQEHLLADLNNALSSQQTQLIELESLCQGIVARLRSMSDQPDGGDPADEKPPHY